MIGYKLEGGVSTMLLMPIGLSWEKPELPGNFGEMEHFTEVQ